MLIIRCRRCGIFWLMAKMAICGKKRPKRHDPAMRRVLSFLMGEDMEWILEKQAKAWFALVRTEQSEGLQSTGKARARRLNPTPATNKIARQPEGFFVGFAGSVGQATAVRPEAHTKPVTKMTNRTNTDTATKSENALIA